jgi:uncharacterized protein
MHADSSKSVFQKIVQHPAFLLLVGFVLILASRLAIEIPAQIYMPDAGRTDIDELIIFSAISGASVLMYWFIVRFIERKPFADFSLPGAGREWLMGAAIGTGAMSITIGAIAAFGGYRIIGYNGPEILLAVLSMAIVSGIFEEVWFRGVVFRYLEQWLGSYMALGISAFLFGLLHISNPGASWLAAIAIALEAGIMLGAIYMITRRLWAAIGLHMAWNSAQGGLYGVKVSGTDVKGLIVSEPSGSDLLTGGAFGAEASIPAIIICTSIGLYFLWRAHKTGQIIAPSWNRFKTGEDNPMAGADPVIG